MSCWGLKLHSKRGCNTELLLYFSTDQLVSTIPYRVYWQLTALLARDGINLAGRLFNLTLEETMSLSNHTRVDAVFQLMHKRHVSLAQLVQVLDEMQRFDALSVLAEAGFPYHPELHPNFSGTLYTFKQNLQRREHPKFLL